MIICDKKKMGIMNFRRRSFGFLFSICISLFVIGLLSLLACWRPAGLGIGGRYLEAKREITKPRGNLNKAISDLDYVVRRDPFYKESLTLLGRAYYQSRRYRDAFQILRRALAVNRKDEIAQIAMALTQLRLGDDERGLERFKGGITLLIQASKDGYRGYEFWDKKGVIQRTLRRAVIFASRGLEEKKRIILVGEILLARIDDEEWRQEEEAFNEETNVDR
jgi:tetratricopeptide (TPR) repeat protein